MTEEDKPVELILAGQSYRVYLELLVSDEPLGVREIQRRLGFKSPSTAKHHLDRLVRLGLAEKTPDGKYVAKQLGSGFLSAYIIVSGRLVPRLLPVSLGGLAGLLTYIILYYPKIDPVILGLAGVIDIITLYESLRLYLMAKKLTNK